MGGWRNEYSSIVENMILGLTGELPGNKFYVDPTKGSDGGDGSRQSPVKTVAMGYGLLRDGYNDVLYWVPGATSSGVIAPFVWAKSYAHLIGLAGPGVYGGRCRMHDTAAFATMLFSMTGVGNIFKNIHWQRDFDSAIGVQNFTLGTNASYNYFEDCQFDAPIMASLGAAAYRNLTLGDGARSNTFRRCTIGQWNQVAAATDGYQIYGVGGTNGNAGTHFMDCVIMWYGNSASITPINITDLIVVNAYVLFERCKFLGVGTAINGLCAASTPANGKLIFMNCTSVGVAEYAAGTAANVWVANGSAVAGELGGKAVSIA